MLNKQRTWLGLLGVALPASLFLGYKAEPGTGMQVSFPAPAQACNGYSEETWPGFPCECETTDKANFDCQQVSEPHDCHSTTCSGSGDGSGTGSGSGY